MSHLEESFLNLWKNLGPDGYELVREHRFHDTRKWRLDFALVDHRIAIEMEGLLYSGRGGGHQRAGGYQANLDKYNAAAAAGWIVLRFSGADLRSKPVVVIEQIEACIRLVEERLA